MAGEVHVEGRVRGDMISQMQDTHLILHRVGRYGAGTYLLRTGHKLLKVLMYNKNVWLGCMMLLLQGCENGSLWEEGQP